MCYWRMTRFQLPCWTMTGPYGENPVRTTRGWVPMDDEHTMVYAINFHPLRPLTEKELATYRAGAGLHPGVDRYLPATSEPGGAWRMMANASNDYFLDYELQRTEKFCGIPEFWAQDAGLQEGMGPIYDRSKEHLGTTDLGIIRTRQRWLDAARVLRDHGETPPGALDPSAYRVRAAAMLLPEGADWVESAGDNLKVIPGVNPAGV
jgi:phthalate 4,5-dioxygenase